MVEVQRADCCLGAVGFSKVCFGQQLVHALADVRVRADSHAHEVKQAARRGELHGAAIPGYSVGLLVLKILDSQQDSHGRALPPDDEQLIVISDAPEQFG